MKLRIFCLVFLFVLRCRWSLVECPKTNCYAKIDTHILKIWCRFGKFGVDPTPGLTGKNPKEIDYGPPVYRTKSILNFDPLEKPRIGVVGGITSIFIHF